MLEESLLFPLQRQEILSTAKSLFKSSFHISLTLLADPIAGFISFHFAGKYENNVQHNIFYGYFVVYVFFLLPFIASFDQGFAILASKLFGAKKYQELGALYQRHLSLVAACSIPMILLMAFLGFCPGREDDGIFLASMIPSLIGTLLFNSTKYFLISQNIIKAPTLITLGMIPVHVLLCYIFVDILGMHISGIGFAKSIADVTAAILLFSYIRFTGVCRDTWTPLTKECLKNWKSHLQRTFIVGDTNFIDFYTYGFSFFFTFLTFWIKKESEIGEVAPTLAYALFCIPWGISLSVQTQISYLIGEGSQEKVKKVMAGGIALNSLFSLTTVISIVIFRKQIASFLENENEIFENILLIFTIAFIFDSYSNIIGGVLKVIGKEKQVGKALSVSSLCAPGQLFFGIAIGYGYIAVWLCLAVTALLKCARLIYELKILNWEEQIQKAISALDEQAPGEAQGFIEFADMAYERKE